MTIHFQSILNQANKIAMTISESWGILGYSRQDLSCAKLYYPAPKSLSSTSLPLENSCTGVDILSSYDTEIILPRFSS